MSKPKLTILTPTYNRAHTLSQAYDSLCKQSCKDFVWLIVDDGSTDNTKELVSAWDRSEHGFVLRYEYKENGGKHTAINHAVEFIDTELVLILDSDDYLTPDAVYSILEHWRNYENDSTVCGLSFLKGVDNDTPIQTFPDEICRSNHIDFRINRNLPGDCCEVIRTEVLRKFPFPVFNGERFLGECYLWINAALEYDTVYISRIIYICNYLDDGLTKSGRSMRLKNPHGGMLTSKTWLNHRICLKQRVKKAILYSCYGFAAKMPVMEIIKSSRYPFVVTLFVPAGYFFYRLWKN